MVDKVRQAEKRNIFCILGFIYSIFTCILGFVLSVLGLIQVKKTGELGKGFAIAGIVLVLSKIFLFLVWSFFFVSPSITPNLALDTVCGYVDEEGNYENTESEYSDGEIVCKNYVCVVTYEGKEFKKKCN